MFQTGHTQRCRNRTNFSCSSCSKLIGSFKIFKRQSGRKLLSSAQGRVDSSLTSDILPRNTCRTPCQQVPFSHSEGLRFKWNNEMEFRKFRSFKFVGRMTFQHSCICAQRSQRSLRPTVESVDLLILLACTSLAKWSRSSSSLRVLGPRTQGCLNRARGASSWGPARNASGEGIALEWHSVTHCHAWSFRMVQNSICRLCTTIVKPTGLESSKELQDSSTLYKICNSPFVSFCCFMLFRKSLDVVSTYMWI